MILRKPYAFLIKNFKLIHFILVGLILYLMYRTNIILNFFNEYVASTQVALAGNLTGTLFQSYMFIACFLVVAIAAIMLVTMSIKKKPLFFYILMILIYIYVFVMINISYSTIGELELHLLDTRQVRLVRDFLMIGFILQCFVVIITFIRATGFDIKKFDFGKDLQELDIADTDNEEFEFELDVDTNRLKRGLRRNARYAKYVYVENKFFIDIGILLAIALICFLTYMNLGIYNKTLDNDTMFSTVDYAMGIQNAYITKKDYKGNTLTTDTSLIVLDVRVKSYNTIAKQISFGAMELHVGNKTFYHSLQYKDRLFDLGHAYDDSSIPTEFTNYLFIYEVPDSLLNKKMFFRFVDRVNLLKGEARAKYIRVSVHPFDLDPEKKPLTYSLEQTVPFTQSIFKKSTISIMDSIAAPYFKVPYQFCVDPKTCNTSYEYIRPTYSGNEETALLRLEGNITIDENIVLDDVYNLFDFISKFGTLNYKLNGAEKKQKITWRQVKPYQNLARKKDVYYLEIPKEALQGTDFVLSFKIRNYIYQYQLTSKAS